MVLGELIAGRCLVQGFLGMGIVSVVYSTVDNVGVRPVAVKLLRSRFLEMRGLAAPGGAYPMAELLRREIHLHSGVHHPRIVEMLDHGTWEDRPFAALEYVPDPSVERQFGDGLAPAEAISIMSEVLDALTYLHDSGTIDRELKPENIHYGPENGVILLDCGRPCTGKGPGTCERVVVTPAVATVRYLRWGLVGGVC